MACRCSCNAPGVPRFQPHPGYLLSWQRFCVVGLCLCKGILRQNLQIGHDCFHVLSSPFMTFTFHSFTFEVTSLNNLNISDQRNSGLGAQRKSECEPLASVPRLDWLNSSRRAVLAGVELGMSVLV